MTRLTTHILNLAHGEPAAGVTVEVFYIQSPAEKVQVGCSVTNEDGRLNQPLIDSIPFTAGDYELLFHIGDYFKGKPLDLGDPPFLNYVSVRVYLSANEEHYHIPLLVSPWGYQVYRGS